MQADNLRIPALIVVILAWALVAFTSVASLAHTVWLVTYTQLAESPWMLTIASYASIANAFAFYPSIIAVMVWVYIAHSNLHRAKLSGLNYSPAWATFSFLVPVANLLVPFRAMRELANRSAGEPMELAEADVDAVQSWWGAWIGSLVVGHFLLYAGLVEIIPFLFLTTPFWATQGITILGGILTAASAFFLIQVVRQITQNQQDGINDLATFE